MTFPFLGRAYFPRTDPGQFIINVRMPSGTRLEVSNDYIAKVEDVIRSVVKPKDLDMIVSNIGVYPGSSVNLHDQCFHGHSLRADQPEGGPQHRQL